MNRLTGWGMNGTAPRYGRHHLAEIAGATRMLALHAVQPIAVFVARRGQQVMHAAGVLHELQDGAPLVAVE